MIRALLCFATTALLLPSPRLCAQTSLPDSFRLNLDPGAERLATDQEANLYVSNPHLQRLIKYYRAWAYDSSSYLGGSALQREGLNRPAKAEPANRQSLYLHDQGNRRLLLLNPNLRIVREFNFLNTPVRLPGREDINLNPTSFAAGPSGELYVLNLDDSRIYKFDRFGQVELAFGGPDFGEGSLRTPDDLVVTSGNAIFVSDTLQQQIWQFNLFGVYEQRLSPGFRWKRLKAAGDDLLLVSDHQVSLLSRTTGRLQTLYLHTANEVIADASLHPGRLWVLMPNHLLGLRLE